MISNKDTRRSKSEVISSRSRFIASIASDTASAGSLIQEYFASKPVTQDYISYKLEHLQEHHHSSQPFFFVDGQRTRVSNYKPTISLPQTSKTEESPILQLRTPSPEGEEPEFSNQSDCTADQIDEREEDCQEQVKGAGHTQFECMSPRSSISSKMHSPSHLSSSYGPIDLQKQQVVYTKVRCHPYMEGFDVLRVLDNPVRRTEMVKRKRSDMIRDDASIDSHKSPLYQPQRTLVQIEDQVKIFIYSVESTSYCPSLSAHRCGRVPVPRKELKSIRDINMQTARQRELSRAKSAACQRSHVFQSFNFQETNLFRGKKPTPYKEVFKPKRKAPSMQFSQRAHSFLSSTPRSRLE